MYTLFIPCIPSNDTPSSPSSSISTKYRMFSPSSKREERERILSSYSQELHFLEPLTGLSICLFRYFLLWLWMSSFPSVTSVSFCLFFVSRDLIHIHLTLSIFVVVQVSFCLFCSPFLWFLLCLSCVSHVSLFSSGCLFVQYASHSFNLYFSIL